MKPSLNPSAGIIRIRFGGLALASQPRRGTPLRSVSPSGVPLPCPGGTPLLGNVRAAELCHTRA